MHSRYGLRDDCKRCVSRFHALATFGCRHIALKKAKMTRADSALTFYIGKPDFSAFVRHVEALCKSVERFCSGAVGESRKFATWGELRIRDTGLETERMTSAAACLRHAAAPNHRDRQGGSNG
jgi:hypothetical protein